MNENVGIKNADIISDEGYEMSQVLDDVAESSHLIRITDARHMWLEAASTLVSRCTFRTKTGRARPGCRLLDYRTSKHLVSGEQTVSRCLNLRHSTETLVFAAKSVTKELAANGGAPSFRQVPSKPSKIRLV